MIEPWQGVADSTRKKISGEPGRAGTWESGLVSRGIRKRWLREEKENIAF
jgi:hypothetical protein